MGLSPKEQPSDSEGVRTEMIVCHGNTQNKVGIGVTFDVYAALIQTFRAFHVTFFEFLGTLFHATRAASSAGSEVVE